MKSNSNKNIKNLRVLMFGPNRFATGGISNVVNNWIESGIEKVIQLNYVSTLTNCVPGQYIYKFWNAINAYYHLIVKSRDHVDIVHIHMSSDMSFFRKWFIFKYSKWKKNKTIIHIHSGEIDRFYNNSNKYLKKSFVSMLESTDGVIVLTQTWKKFIQTISSNQNIYVLHNGSSLYKFSGKVNDESKIVVLCMGRLGANKGTYDLVEAFEKALKIIPDLQLILGGDGDVDQVRENVSKMGLKEHVAVPGWIAGEEKTRIFKSCDIYALPSYNEGLPGSILEAMAVGVPIISTPVGGIPEAVIENRNGFLITPGDVDSLCGKIVELGQNKKLREKMGRESQKIIKEKFEINSIVGRLGEIYGEVAER